VIGVAARAFETGQFFFASSASRLKVASSIPGTLPSVAGDAPSLVGLVEVHARHGSNFLRLVAGLGQATGERHGKAAGMRRTDQLFRVCAGAILHPALERIGSFKGAASQPHRSRSVL
jgi:hypothetical protein